jgi:hypothetical protein
MSFTDTIENALVEACRRMDYGIDINVLKKSVTVTRLHGIGKRQSHRFTSAARALGWVEQQERQRATALARFNGCHGGAA